MNTEFLIEAVGYLGSLLVLVSMLMTSVVKLRIINMIGSIIFTIYALIIKSYPTAFMNFCLVLINLRFLWKLKRMGKEYEIVESDHNDNLLIHLLNHYKADIDKCFPGLQYSLDKDDTVYVVLCEEKPVGFMLGYRDGDTLLLELDYSIPEYRDNTIGEFLYRNIAKKGVKRAVYKGPADNHMPYLNHMGFVKTDEGYVKEL